LLFLNQLRIFSEPWLKHKPASSRNGVVGNSGTIIPIIPTPTKTLPSIFQTGLGMFEKMLLLF